MARWSSGVRRRRRLGHDGGRRRPAGLAPRAAGRRSDASGPDLRPVLVVGARSNPPARVCDGQASIVTQWLDAAATALDLGVEHGEMLYLEVEAAGRGSTPALLLMSGGRRVLGARRRHRRPPGDRPRRRPWRAPHRARGPRRPTAGGRGRLRARPRAVAARGRRHPAGAAAPRRGGAREPGRTSRCRSAAGYCLQADARRTFWSQLQRAGVLRRCGALAAVHALHTRSALPAGGPSGAPP